MEKLKIRDSFIAAFMAFSMIILMMPLSVFAETTSPTEGHINSWDMDWYLDEDGTLYLAGGPSLGDMMSQAPRVCADTNQGCATTTIPWDKTRVKSVVALDGVSVLPNGIFDGCTNLKEVTIPESLMVVVKNAFKDCPIEKVNYSGNEETYNQIKNPEGSFFNNVVSDEGNDAFWNTQPTYTNNSKEIKAKFLSNKCLESYGAKQFAQGVGDLTSPAKIVTSDTGKIKVKYGNKDGNTLYWYMICSSSCNEEQGIGVGSVVGLLSASQNDFNGIQYSTTHKDMVAAIETDLTSCFTSNEKNLMYLNNYKSPSQELVMFEMAYTHSYSYSKEESQVVQLYYYVPAHYVPGYDNIISSATYSGYTDLDITKLDTNYLTDNKTYCIYEANKDSEKDDFCIKNGEKTSEKPTQGTMVSYIPTFNLLTTDILFVSSAEACTENAEYDADNVMTIRFNAGDNISSTVKYNHTGISVNYDSADSSKDVYLYASGTDTSGKEFLYSTKVTKSIDLSNTLNDIAGINATTRVWLETEGENNSSFSYAKMATFDETLNILAPSMLNGDGQQLSEGTNKSLSFRSNAPFADFIKVLINGVELDKSNYICEEGSTKVTLKADYVASLKKGEYKLSIVSKEGTAEATFTVAKANANTNTNTTTNTTNTNTNTTNTNTINTGDTNSILLYTGTAILALLGIAAMLRKKKEANK